MKLRVLTLLLTAVFAAVPHEAQLFPLEVGLDSIGEDGLVLRGVSSVDRLGFSAAGIGDINADGFPDVAIGSKAGNGSLSVVFGGPTVLVQELDIEDLGGTNGFFVDGDDFGNMHVALDPTARRTASAPRVRPAFRARRPRGRTTPSNR